MPVRWTHILRWAPEIITLSRELLQHSRRKPDPTELVRIDDLTDFGTRIATLEENERRQAELVERMAEQQADLARAVLALHRRERLLIGAIVVLAALLSWVWLR